MICIVIIIYVGRMVQLPVITQGQALDTARASIHTPQHRPSPILELSHAKPVTVLRTGNLTPDGFFS